MQKLSRREFIKITAMAGGGLLGASLIPKGFIDQPYTLTDTRDLMGTIIHLKIVCTSRKVGEDALNKTFSEMKSLVNIFNLRDENSQITKLNQTGALHDASTEIRDVISQAIKISDYSNGAFDITIQPVLAQIRAGNEVSSEIKSLVDYKKILISKSSVYLQKKGMQITLDGIAKGFVVDRGVDTLKGLGFQNVLVEAGGDLAVSGKNLHGEGWRIGISNPRPKNLEGYLSVFSIDGGAVATSGDYINTFNEDKTSHHIIDPVSNQSPRELSSVTVHAPSAVIADALSTTIMVMGLEKGLELANKLDYVEAYVVTKEMVVQRTNGFPTSSLR